MHFLSLGSAKVSFLIADREKPIPYQLREAKQLEHSNLEVTRANAQESPEGIHREMEDSNSRGCFLGLNDWSGTAMGRLGFIENFVTNLIRESSSLACE